MMTNLTEITVSFVTHRLDAGSPFTPKVGLVHVFLMNRSADTSRPVASSDLISDHLAYEEADAKGLFDINPFLGRLPPLALPIDAATPYVVQLRRQPIPIEELTLPVIAVHLQTPFPLVWSFTCTLIFRFDDGTSLAWSSDADGITSIRLDNECPNYLGICREACTPVPVPRPASSPVYLTSVTVDIGTSDSGHAERKKLADTRVHVHIANRLSATKSQDIAIARDLLVGREMPIPQPPDQAAVSGSRPRASPRDWLWTGHSSRSMRSRHIGPSV
jgi:hypothetical protein